MSKWSTLTALVIASLATASPAWAFHRHKVVVVAPASGFVAAPGGFVTHGSGFVGGSTTGFVAAPTGFVAAPTGFVAAPTGFVTAPTGFVAGSTGFISTPTTGFLAAPTGFSATHLVITPSSSSGFNTGSGFSTDAALTLPAGVTTELLRRLLSSTVCGASGASGGSGVSGEVGTLLRDIRDELRGIRAELQGGDLGTTGTGTSGTPPTVTGRRINPDAFSAGSSSGFSVNPVNPQAFNRAPALVQASSYIEVAEESIARARAKIAEAKNTPGYTPAQIQQVEARLKGLAEKLK